MHTGADPSTVPRRLLADQLHELCSVAGGGRQCGQSPLHEIQAARSEETHSSPANSAHCLPGLLPLPRLGARHHRTMADR